MGVTGMPQWIWGQLSYVLALFAGCALVARQMTLRKNGGLRIVISCIGIAGAKMLLDYFILQNMNSGDLKVTVNLSFSVMLLALISLASTWCYECDIYAGLFCGTIGYSLQHISQRVYLMYYYLLSKGDALTDGIILTVITAATYWIAYQIILRKVRFYHVIVDNKLQIAISTIFIISIIFMDQFVLNAAVSNAHRIQIILLSIGSCLMGIMLELSNMSSRNFELQCDLFSRLRMEEKDKYNTDRNVIELLNIKAHDLKHQLAASGTELDEEALRETGKVLSAYEEIVQTGNKALDAILTHKLRQAKARNIKMTYLVDGEKMSFMSDIDLYSFFGNILDNAIESAKKMEDPEKRIISISVNTKGFFVSVSASNYFVGTIELVNGLPKTTKSDRIYHGFGLQSIKMLTEKYHGDLKISTKEDIFTLDILFPV